MCYQGKGDANNVDVLNSLIFEDWDVDNEDFSVAQVHPVDGNQEICCTGCCCWRCLPQFVAPVDEKMGVEQVFELLDAASKGQLDPDIPIRHQASPISVSTRCFFVVPSEKGPITSAQKLEQMGDSDPLIGVKYQSFSNADIWWSERTNFTRGIVARNMSKKVRSYKCAPTEEHGYGGQWFSLVVRDDPAQVVVRTNCRQYTQTKCPSLVQFWKIPRGSGKNREFKKRRMVERNDRYIPSEDTNQGALYPREIVDTDAETDSPISCMKDSITKEETVVIKGTLNVKGDAEFDGDLTVQNLHVKGTLTVGNGIRGQLMTPPEAADYAEWFEKLDPEEEICCGDIVQLRSPEQKITKNTSGKGPILVVSTNPSVAAGVPHAKKHLGQLCGFLGQVPVKCKGPIKCGQLLVPSGLNDGCAIVGKAFHSAHVNPIGTAMESCEEGIHTILLFVRWAHDPEWQMGREAENNAVDSTWQIWSNTMIFMLVSSTQWMLLFFNTYEPLFTPTLLQLVYFVESISGVWALLHSPHYVEFVSEVEWFYGVAASKVLVSMYCLLEMFVFIEEEEFEKHLTRAVVVKLLFDSSFLLLQVLFGVVQFLALRRAIRWTLAKYNNPTKDELKVLINDYSTFEHRRKILVGICNFCLTKTVIKK
uniref:Uncharacterized protein n=1 Tax=Mucochytrium quahogii TaxID=96639 RepID=A0A7S2SAN5_9STRA|mmetsp:Transcript_8532/g.13845  ORF Transcript_8532/g.13845 Transcript_8532/m.13845 type:complete len:648 (+) Transcript_8532:41-1984(+)